MVVYKYHNSMVNIIIVPIPRNVIYKGKKKILNICRPHRAHGNTRPDQHDVFHVLPQRGDDGVASRSNDKTLYQPSWKQKKKKK